MIYFCSVGSSFTPSTDNIVKFHVWGQVGYVVKSINLFKTNFSGVQSPLVEKSFNECAGKQTSAIRGKRTQDPFWAVLNSVRKHLKNRVYGGVLSKSEVVALVLKDAEYCENEFFYEFSRKSTRLLRDAQFCDNCQELKINPAVLAQHVVFAGKTKYQLSHEKRLEDLFVNGKLASMQEPIFALETIGEKTNKPLALPQALCSGVFKQNEIKVVAAC